MRICESCQNEYQNCFEVVMNGRTHVFDCFECAVHMLAPRCEHCRCRVIGHGVEKGDSIFCCANCARSEGVLGLKDQDANLLFLKPKEW